MVERQKLINDLREFAEELGHVPTVSEMNKEGPYSRQTYRSQFGKWNDALRESGLKVQNRSSYSRNELLEAIEEYGEELGRRPTGLEMEEKWGISRIAFNSEFGTWGNALEICGYDPNSMKHLTSEEELIFSLKKLSEELGRTPTRNDMRFEGDYSANIYQSKFGTWNKAIREAGMEPNNEPNIPDKLLLREIKRLAEDLSKPPRVQDMRNEGEYSIVPYQRAFGSWNNSVRKAGFEPEKEHNIPERRLVKELRNLSVKMGHPPTQEEMAEHGSYCSPTYVSTFGSWWESLEACGLNPNRKPGRTNEIFYGSTWPEMRKKRLEKDGYECLNCSLSHEDSLDEHNRSLSVHHIEPVRNFVDEEGVVDKSAHKIENLRSLCEPCHREWEGVKDPPF